MRIQIRKPDWAVKYPLPVKIDNAITEVSLDRLKTDKVCPLIGDFDGPRRFKPNLNYIDRLSEAALFANKMMKSLEEKEGK